MTTPRQPRPQIGQVGPLQIIAWRRRVAAALARIEAVEATITRGRIEATAVQPERRGEDPAVREAGGKYAFDRSETGRVAFDRLADAHRDAQTFALAVLALER